MKKKIISFVIILGIIIGTIFSISLYAGTGKLYTNLTAADPNGIGYGKGKPQEQGGKYIWHMSTYDSIDGKLSDVQKDIYCLQADYGASWENVKDNATSIIEYNMVFDLQKDRENVSSKMTVNSNDEGGVVQSLLDEKGEHYRPLLWLMDNMYIRGEDITKYLEWAGMVYNAYYDQYYNVNTGEMYGSKLLLTETDIMAIQRMAIWTITNGGDYDKTVDGLTQWLYITEDYSATYSAMSTKDKKRNTQAIDLYNYLVDSAREGASLYTAENDYTITDLPVEVNASESNVTTTKLDTNYCLIGPIVIDKNNESLYTIEMILTDKNDTEITSDKYSFTDVNGDVLDDMTLKDLVGNSDGFYIKLAKILAEEVNIKIDITHRITNKNLWLAGTETTNEIQLDAEQPIGEISRESETITTQFRTGLKQFDLALRKYITAVNGLNVTNTRVPNILLDTLETETTASYNHKKDPIVVKNGDIVTYNITVYNEGELNGYTSEIIDQLPEGLKYAGNSTITANKNTYNVTYNETTNKIIFTNTTNVSLNKYEKNSLDNETLEFTCEVIATPDKVNDKILTNVAWISGAYDSESNLEITEVGDDRDSRPQTSPSVTSTDIEDYKGNSSNKNDLADSKYHYMGEQDDDDFEKLVIEPEIEIVVVKTWDDNNNQDGIRAEKVEISLYANGTAVEGKTVILDDSNDWKYIFTNLPLKSNGATIIYSVEETSQVTGYTTSPSGSAETGFTITNTHTPEVISIPVTKVWEDSNDQDGIRPESITVNLKDGNTTVETVTLNEENSWTHTFTDLLKNSNGTEIEYKIEEVSVDGYSTEISGDKTAGFTITNTHIPGTKEIQVRKIWNDNENQDGLRPDEIKVQLYANEIEVDGKILTLSTENSWTQTYENLPKYEAGQIIEYTVKETGVPAGYTSLTSGNMNTGYTITNIYTPGLTSVKVTKIWNDNNNQDGIRPQSVNVSLKADNQEVQKIDLNESNNWQYIFTNLPIKKDGQDIVYTIIENTQIEGYTTTITNNNVTETAGKIQRAVAPEFTITNTHETDEINITVNKVWQDENNYDEIRPTSVVVNVKNGESIVGTVTLNEENNWTHTFENLPAKDNGTNINYTIEEIEPEGYKANIVDNGDNTYTITNTHIPEKIFDLALRKYIIKINNNELKTLGLKTRVPNISETSLKTGTTANYRHRKNSVQVEENDIITYAITIYNEGEKAGYASQIIDQLPTGLIFNPSTTVISRDKEGNEKNTYTVEYEASTNKVIFDIVNTTENPAKQLQPYKEGSLDSETLEIKCKVVYKAVAGEKNILTNLAWINEAYDVEDNKKITTEVGADRDSEPGNKPNVNKDNMEDYKGNESNKDELTDDTYHYKGEQDDDDFEKIYVKTFDLSLRKYISSVNGNVPETSREPVVDVSNLVNGTGTTAVYNHPKTPMSLKVGDTVIYTIRVYNEGEIDGDANEVKDYLPPYLQYVENSTINSKYEWSISEDGRVATTTYLSNKKILAFNGTVLDYEDLQIECKISSDAIPYERITNIAEISEYKYGDTTIESDSDSKSDNIDENIPSDEKLPDYKKDNESDSYVPGNEDDDDFEKVYVKEFDLALRKFIAQVQNEEITSRIPQAKDENGVISYEHPKDAITVHVGDTIIYTLRIYNEGEIDGYASEISDDIPEYLEYLPDDSTNVEYMWKMYDENGNETENVEQAVKIKTRYLSKENGEDNLIKAYDGQNLYYRDVKIAFKVKDPNSNEYIITNYAQISDDTDENGNEIKDKDSETDEWNDGEDDQDIEYVKVEYFDLSILKFVSKVIIQENGTEKITETGYNGHENPEPVVKVELHKKKLEDVVVKFGYGITVTNEGDIAGFATEITDYIPEGLKFEKVDNPEWIDEGNNIISTKQLENTLLQPGESKTIEVILTWINGSENLALKTNIVEISEDKNQYEVSDTDSTPDNKVEGEDDIDLAKVILAITTGATKTYFTLTIGLLAVVAIGILLIKKFVI